MAVKVLTVGMVGGIAGGIGWPFVGFLFESWMLPVPMKIPGLELLKYKLPRDSFRYRVILESIYNVTQGQLTSRL